MSNKEFFEKMSSMFEDRSLIYAEKKLPDEFIRIKIGGHFMATSYKNGDFLKEIKTKINEGQFFTEPQLNRMTGKSPSYSNGEVRRGKYERIFVGKFKLYIVKDW